VSASRTERLLNLLIALLNTKYGLSRATLREKVYHDTGDSDSAFLRMFERDKADLRQFGFEIETVTDKGFGSDDPASTRYRIGKDSNRLPVVSLTPAECTVLMLAAQLWEHAALGSAAATAVRKLEAAGGFTDVELPAGVQPRIRPAGQAFDDLLSAMHAQHPVAFSYLAASTGRDERRTVEPWGLGSRFGQWYLVGFDRDRGAKRFYRLSRITSAISIDSRSGYQRPATFDIRAELDSLPELPLQEAVLDVVPGRVLGLRKRATASPARDAAPAVESGDAHADSVAKGLSPRDRLAVMYRDVEVFAEELASYGPNVRVHAPRELREAVIRRLEGAAAASRSPLPDVRFAETVAAAPSRKRTSEDQLSRMLQLVPFLVHHQGLHVQEVAKRFGISRKELISDLKILICSGLPEGYPDDLLDIQWEDDHVFITQHLDLNRPVRFSVEEASALLTGLATLNGLPGLDLLSDPAANPKAPTAPLPDGEADPVVASPLESVTLKLAGAAGEEGRLAAAVAGPPVSPQDSAVFETVSKAIREGRQLRLRYFSPQRDAVTERDVDPLRLYSLDNTWYFEAWCHSKSALRNFRLDRVDSLTRNGRPVSGNAPKAGDAPVKLFTPNDDDVTVVLQLTPQSAGLADAYYAERTSELPDGGGLLAEIRFGNVDWLPMFIAQHGGGARIVAPEELRSSSLAWISDGLEQYDSERMGG
jgi:proteasome accessory factor C